MAGSKTSSGAVKPRAGTACLRAGRAAARPEPLELVRAFTRAKNRRAAFDALAPSPFFPYEYEPFVESGELVHRSLVAARDLDEAACEGLSEPR